MLTNKAHISPLCLKYSRPQFVSPPWYHGENLKCHSEVHDVNMITWHLTSAYNSELHIYKQSSYKLDQQSGKLSPVVTKIEWPPKQHALTRIMWRHLFLLLPQVVTKLSFSISAIYVRSCYSTFSQVSPGSLNSLLFDTFCKHVIWADGFFQFGVNHGPSLDPKSICTYLGPGSSWDNFSMDIEEGEGLTLAVGITHQVAPSQCCCSYPYIMFYSWRWWVTSRDLCQKFQQTQITWLPLGLYLNVMTMFTEVLYLNACFIWIMWI